MENIKQVPTSIVKLPYNELLLIFFVNELFVEHDDFHCYSCVNSI